MGPGGVVELLSKQPLPRFLTQLVRALLSSDRAEDVLGDLEEGSHLRADRLGERAANRWMWREVAALAVWRLGPRGLVSRALGNRNDLKWEGTMWGRDLVQDLRFAIRTLRRRPGFTGTAVLVLALGIGAPTTVFSLVNRIFFVGPAEVVEPHRLVRLYREWAPGQGGGSLGNPDYLYYRNAASTLAGLAAYSGSGQIASYSTGPGESDQLGVQFVSDNFFDVLGATPVFGRTFLTEENATPGTHPVVVVSHGFWLRVLGGASRAVGRTISINEVAYTVVGVMPEAFRGIAPTSARPDAWLPIAMNGSLSGEGSLSWWERRPGNTSRWLNVIGRLAPGVTFEAAEANLLALSAALEYEGRDPDDSIWVRRGFLYNPTQERQLSTMSQMLLAVVGIVLLIAAANVTVLLLSRATERTREMGVRAAMGAGRGRVIRQLLAESLVLGGAGGALGIVLAYASADLAASLMPVAIDGSFAPDASVVGAAVLLTLLISVLVGIVPALQSARPDVRGAIQSTGSGSGMHRMRGALVVGQLGLSLMLVAGSLLFVKSFVAADSQDLGFETEDRLVVQLDLRRFGYGPEQGNAIISDALEGISGLPGVRKVTTSRSIPFGGEWSTSFDTPVGAVADLGEEIYSGLNTVSAGYFDLMGIGIVDGRPLTEVDAQGAPRAVVISQEFAETVWPAERAVGKTLPLSGEGDLFTVVGVARNANYYELGEAPGVHAYYSVKQIYRPTVTFLVATAVPATELAPPVQDVIRTLVPGVAFSIVSTLAAELGDQVARYQAAAKLVTLFGAVALLLASVGLYGAVSFLVSQNTRDIGVRMALGANQVRVARGVLKTGVRLAGLGLALGLVGSVALRRFTQSMLYGVQAADPAPLVGSIVILSAVTVLASVLPARRATRVDPMQAIRAE